MLLFNIQYFHLILILNKKDNSQIHRINYKDSGRCPLKGICLVNNMIYKATIREEDSNNEKI